DGGTANMGVDTVTRTFDVVVTEVNDAPVAVDDTPAGTYLEDAAQYVFTEASLLANDNAGPEEGSQTITIDSVGAAVGGSVSLNGSNDVVFVPAANFNGAASFTYTITDNGTTNGAPDVLTDTATVSFEITAENDPPTISDVTDRTIDEDTNTGTIVFTVNDVETAAADLTVTATSDNQTLVTNANLVLAGSGANRTLVATPEQDANGFATITLTVTDGDATVIDTFLLTVDPVNDAPVAQDDTFSVDENSPALTVVGTVQASDVDMDTLSFGFGGFATVAAPGTNIGATDGAGMDVSTLLYNRNAASVRLAQDAFFAAIAAQWSGTASFATYNATTGVLTITNTFWASLLVDLTNIGGPFADLGPGQTASMSVNDLT
ncbi:Ig-like domain-containing protein, partial [Aquimonas voraii]